jgi:hypothetical protein
VIGNVAGTTSRASATGLAIQADLGYVARIRSMARHRWWPIVQQLRVAACFRRMTDQFFALDG